MNKGLDIKGKLCLELEFDDVEKLIEEIEFDESLDDDEEDVM